MNDKGYGWRPQKPDHRDHFFHLEERILQAHQLPIKYDLWPHVPPIWDQGRLGSCTAHGSLRAFLTEALRQGEKVPMLSRLMQYFDTRSIEGTTDYDAGGEVRDAIRVLAQFGCAPETDWPYNIEDFAVKPPPTAYTDAAQHMAVKYQSITVGGPGAPIRTALASGLAVAFGFSVPQSFQDGSWDPATQVLPLPGLREQFVGGHCVAITGYDFSRLEHPEPYFVVDNSWGSGWGFEGRFRMAADWFSPDLGLATDLWCIQATN